MTDNGIVAKTALLSSALTLLVLAAGVFVFRDAIIGYLNQALVIDAPAAASVQLPVTTDQRIVNAIAEVNDAVVSIIITKEVPVFERYYETFDPFGLFGGFSVPRVRENGTELREIGGGSGFIVSNDGMIVTNRHVVEDDEAFYSVLLNDGTAYDAVVLARDPQLDIAILKIDEPLESSLTYARFGDSESLRLGETVIAIGNALAEFRNSVSVGVVSGLARSVVATDGMGRSEQLDQVIQTDAAINPGNSGGPLLNLDGEVIGVNVATSRGADNIGFALPAHIVKRVVESVRENGEIIRPYLGVRYVMLNSEMAERNGLPVSYGAYIIGGDDAAVLPGSPADRAGLADGSVILSIDGVTLRETELATVLRGKEVGQEIELVVWQDGVERTVSVTLEAAPRI
jgi:serine protease Do